MATVTARTLPWYSPPRVKQAMRQARRLPVVPVALLTFLLLIPALLAPLVAPYDPLKGSLAKGRYTAHWRITAADGDAQDGTFHFRLR